MGHLTPFGTKVEEFTGASSSELPVEQDVVANVEGASMKKEATLSGDSDKSSTSLAASWMLGRKEPRIRLSSDSFDGLFTNKSAEGVSSRKNVHRLARIPRKKAAEQQTQESGASTSESTLEPSDDISLVDQEDWIPSLAQFMEPDSSSSESEYLTDDDMGETRAKKGKRMRELSDLSSDEPEGTGSRKRGKGRRKRKKQMTAKYNDDGDEDVYRLRMQ